MLSLSGRWNQETSALNAHKPFAAQSLFDGMMSAEASTTDEAIQIGALISAAPCRYE